MKKHSAYLGYALRQSKKKGGKYINSGYGGMYRAYSLIEPSYQQSAVAPAKVGFTVTAIVVSDLLAYTNTEALLTVESDLLAYEAFTTYAPVESDLLVYNNVTTLATVESDLLAYNNVTTQAIVESDLLSYTAFTASAVVESDLLAYVAFTTSAIVESDLLIYANTTATATVESDLLAYLPTTTQAIVESDLLIYTNITTSAVVESDLLAYTNVTTYAVVESDLLAYVSATVQAIVESDLLAYEGVYAVAIVESDLDATEIFNAWAVNILTGAVSKYEAFNFNSISKRFACGSGGIYRLGATSDNGTAISGFVETGKVDFGTSQKKRVTYSYIGKDGGKLRLSVDADNTGYINYDFPKTTQYENLRNRLALGAQGRYWKFKLANVNGSDAEVDSQEVIVDKLSRKI